MSRWLKTNLLVVLGLLAANGLVYWLSHAYPERVAQARQTAAPEGQRYLDACDGRLTDVLGPTVPDSCLADYPGEFGRAVVLGSSVTLLVLVNLGYLFLFLFRKTRDPHTEDEIEP
jgi:hypothetical protein